MRSATPLAARPAGVVFPVVFALAIAAASTAWVPLHARAQSITTGALAGRVLDELQAPLFDADVSVVDRASGAERDAITDRSGQFLVGFLTPGEYDLRVEAVGFRPKFVSGVPVRPGIAVDFQVSLEPESPPVTAVDTVFFGSAATGWIRPGASRWFSELELRDLPDADRGLGDLLALTSEADWTSGAIEGMPAALTGLYTDGIRIRAIRLPGANGDPYRFLKLPRSSLGAAELVLGEPDIEWDGSVAGALSASSRPGSRVRELSVFGDFTGSSLWSSQALDGEVPSSQSVRGGFRASLPITPDSTHVSIGAEAWRIQTPVPALFPDGGAPLGVDPVALTNPTVEEVTAVSGFARLDWIGLRNRVSVRVNGALMPESEAPAPGFPVGARVPWGVEASDLSLGVQVSSEIDDRLLLESRLGVDVGSRTYRGSPGSQASDAFPGTRLPGTGVQIGTSPLLPADVSRLGFYLAPTLHLTVDRHRLKFGLAGDITLNQYDQSFGSAGLFDLGQGTTSPVGAFVQTDLAGVRSDFTLPSVGVFAQDNWAAAPGVQLVAGVRYNVVRLPDSDWERNLAWDSLTATPPSDLVDRVESFATRVGFVWDVGSRGRTFLRAGVGVYSDEFDPTLVHELLTNDGRVNVRRALDGGGAWPGLPSSTSTAPGLSLVGDDVDAPRSVRGSAGITQSLGYGLALHLAGVARRTELLPRPADLNLTPVPLGSDAQGRPIYGRLAKRGSWVGALPRGNRRFGLFDQVYALNQDGWSEYRAFSVVVERRGAGSLDVFASYTFSETTDNMPGWGRGGREALLVPDVGLREDAWVEGRSDFDVPHRLVVGWSLTAPVLEGLAVEGVFRYRSGEAFTPGFRDGVDINGDGSGLNDPAFASGGESFSEVRGAWDCLRGVRAGPLERNGCRGDPVSSLDVRARLGLASVGAGTVELLVDVLNLIEPEVGDRDRALFMVDPGASLGQGGLTTPLVVNPDFGEFLTRRDPGRVIRIGIRIRGGR